ncbi:glyoxalase, partial [Pseudomonas aeruginosa]
MSVSGIDEITYGVEDLATSARFFADWGLAQVEASEDQVVF